MKKEKNKTQVTLVYVNATIINESKKKQLKKLKQKTKLTKPRHPHERCNSIKQKNNKYN